MLHIGQRRTYYIWVLTLDHTYDQVLQCRSTTKIIGILAAQAAIEVTKAERNVWKDLHKDELPTTIDVDDTAELDQEIDSDIIQVKCAALYVQIFSQRSSRHQEE